VCLFVFCLFVCTVTDFSTAEKDRGLKFCMRVVLAYYPDRSSPLLVNFGSRESRGGITFWVRQTGELCKGHGMGIRSWGRRRCIKPYGGICILQACWCTFSFSDSLYLFSSFVHLFPFYQNSPTLFPGWRSQEVTETGFSFLCYLYFLVTMHAYFLLYLV